jgi:nucleoside-diphosphate-sugar epimerase
MKFFLTGASGFVGSALALKLRSAGFDVTACSRQSKPIWCTEGIAWLQKPITEISPSDLEDHHFVVHLAAISDTRSAEETAIYEVNQKHTEHVVKCSREACVPNFILFSSIKAVSEGSVNNLTLPQPSSHYGKSKLAAEVEAKRLLLGSDTRLFMLRPAPVYGRPIKANFKLLERIAKYRLPLPIGSLKAERSYLYLDNLLDFVLTLTKGEVEPGEFNLADQDSLALPEFIRLIAAARGSTIYLPPFPLSLLKIVASSLPATYRNLMLVDSIVEENRAQTLLQWKAPFNISDGIAQTFGNSNKP